MTHKKEMPRLQNDAPYDPDKQYPVVVEGVYTAQKTQIVSLQARVAELTAALERYRKEHDSYVLRWFTNDGDGCNCGACQQARLALKGGIHREAREIELESVLADLLRVAQHIRYADWMNEESDLGLQRTRERARDVLGEK